MKSKEIILSLTLLICFLTGCGSTMEKNLELKITETEISEEKEEMVQKDYETATVYICGEVHFPGVYTVYAKSRVCDVLLLAGGFTQQADKEAVNQAEEVYDAQKIYIPSVSEKSTEEEAGKININRADEDTLCNIPGIGQVRAAQILKYRNENGLFKTIEEIMNVSGIKEGTFEKIAPYITVSIIGR